MKNNGRILELAAILAMVVTVLLSVTQFDASCRNVEDAVLRLHVIANSDSAPDQALKLKVRDAILAAGDRLFSGCATKEQAKTALKAKLETVRQVAETTVRNAGYNYPVQVFLTTCDFPTRTYETVTLPAGTYDAVRVVIGNGAGKNWWCVMFPPLCLPAAEDDAALEDVLSAPDVFTVQQNPKYELRFWIVEKIRAWNARAKT